MVSLTSVVYIEATKVSTISDSRVKDELLCCGLPGVLRPLTMACDEVAAGSSEALRENV